MASSFLGPGGVEYLPPMDVEQQSCRQENNELSKRLETFTLLPLL
jgi:hypothetical protein